MKKILLSTFVLSLAMGMTYAADTVFDSMDKAVEVNLQPAAKTTQNFETKVSDAVKIQEEKFTSAISSLDDAQVELRGELTSVTAKYNTALAEKKAAIENCKGLKNEIRAINKKMKNIDKSKKMINANLTSGATSK